MPGAKDDDQESARESARPESQPGSFVALLRMKTTWITILLLLSIAAWYRYCGQNLHIASLTVAEPGSWKQPPRDIPEDEKPVIDTRSYATAVLQNGMEVMTVQDANSENAAFSVGVKAGFYDDPETLPGLAHFCEHMLFLGTERYPDPMGWDEFVRSNGGYSNAYTTTERTVYNVELPQNHAADAIERFSEFFKAPLFDAKYVEKEVNAIDSEHSKNVQDPLRRTYEVMNSIGNPNSPVTRFHTGSTDTLSEAPKKLGVDPLKELKAFFKTFYCPGKMRLVTFGPTSTAEQLRVVNKTFGQIPAGDGACVTDSRRTFAEPAPWPKDRLGKWMNIQGTTPTTQMRLMFPLPVLVEAYASQPLSYLDWQLRYSGSRSLFAFLRDDLGLVNSLNTGADSGSEGAAFFLIVELTEKGRDHAELVLDVIFAYLAALRRKGVDETVYASLAKSLKLNWDASAPLSPTDTVVSFAGTLTDLPLDDIMWGESLIRKMNPELVRQLVDLLQPDNMNIAFIAPDETTLEQSGVKVEELPHYGVRYSVQTIEDVMSGAASRWKSWLAESSDANIERDLQSRLRSGKVSDSMSFPEVVGPIEGLPDSLPLTNAHAAAGDDGSKDSELFGAAPARLQSGGEKCEGDCAIWYRKGWTSNAPKNSPLVSVNVSLRPLRAKDFPELSAEDSLRLSLYSELLAEELQPILAMMVEAGGGYSIEATSSGLHFSFWGFEALLTPTVTKVLHEFDEHKTLPNGSKRFARVAQQFRHGLESYTEMPITYAIQDRSLLLTRGASTKAELLAALDKITEDSVRSAVQDILLKSKNQFTVLAMGNLDEQKVREMEGILTSSVQRLQGNVTVAADAEVERVTRVVVPTQPVEVRAKNPRQGDPNDAIVVSFVAGVATIESRVVLGLIERLLQPLAYEELRTNMQLGYVVNSGVIQLSNVQIISMIVQGTKLKADELEPVVQNVYMNLMPQRLANLTQDEFDVMKDSFKGSLIQKPFYIMSEVEHFWGTIQSDSHCFHLHDSMLRFLDTLASKDALVKAWSSIVTAPTADIRRKLVVKYFAGDELPARPTEAAAVAAWEKQGLSTEHVQLLQREYKQALVVDGATSAVREQLLRNSTYFPADLHCDAGGSSGALSALQAAQPSSFISGALRSSSLVRHSRQAVLGAGAGITR